MWSHIGAWLQHIQKALDHIRVLMQVVVATQAIALPGLFSHVVEQRLIQTFQINHGCHQRCSLRRRMVFLGIMRLLRKVGIVSSD